MGNVVLVCPCRSVLLRCEANARIFHGDEQFTAEFQGCPKAPKSSQNQCITHARLCTFHKLIHLRAGAFWATLLVASTERKLLRGTNPAELKSLITPAFREFTSIAAVRMKTAMNGSILDFLPTASCPPLCSWIICFPYVPEKY